MMDRPDGKMSKSVCNVCILSNCAILLGLQIIRGYGCFATAYIRRRADLFHDSMILENVVVEIFYAYTEILEFVSLAW